MAFRVYLSFKGNCREAFTRYQEVFGGELVLLPMSDAPADAAPPGVTPDPNLIMHAALMTGDGLLMGADDPTGSFDGSIHGICVNANLPDPAEAKRAFDALAEGGSVDMPIAETFFSPAYGICTDRFGVPWMVMVDSPMPA